jgi:hypothetical protein
MYSTVPRTPGSNRTPGSGRKKGTPNKRTGEAREVFVKHKIDPLEVLALMAKGDWKALGYKEGEEPDQKLALELRFYAAKEGAQYLYPKRKAVEITNEGGVQVQVHHVAPEEAASPETWREKYAPKHDGGEK